MKIKYANENKKPNLGLWILDLDSLNVIKNELEKINEMDIGLQEETTLECIEAVLLIANGESDLLIKTLKEIGE